jgi:sigma-B regulation protein RsbU (phosphoserine phosphatase)
VNEIKPVSKSDWKQFLALVEELIALPDAAAQCELITNAAANLLKCQARIWLAKPSYPLPGQPPVPVIPDPFAPQLVNLALEEGQSLCQNGEDAYVGGECEEGKAIQAFAMPLIAQRHKLGVLLVERPPEKPGFKPKELATLETLASYAALALRVSQQSALKNWRSGQLALVRQVSSQIANITDLDELCERITALIQETFQYYEVAIFTLEEGQEELCLRSSTRHSNPVKNTPVYKVKVGEGLIGLVAQLGKEIVAPDVDQDPRYRYFDTLPETQSEATLPIKLENHILGVLDVQSDQLDAFHEHDILVLQALADNIALAVEGAHLYGNLQRRAEQIGAMVEVSHALTSILDLDALLNEVMSVIQKRFGFAYVHIFTVHTGRRLILYEAGSGAHSQGMSDNEVAYGLDDETGMIPWVARNNQSRLANDVSQDPLYRPTDLPPENTRAELVVPLAFNGEVLAILDIQSDQANAFTQEDQSLLEALASSIAIAIRNATLYRTEQWRRQVGDSFRDVANLLSKNVNLDRMLEAVLLELERNLPCDAAAIWLVDETARQGAAGQALKLAAVRGVASEALLSARDSNEPSRQWLEQILDSDSTSVREPPDPLCPFGVALGFPADYSAIAVPMRIGERAIGVLSLAHHTPGRYGSEARLMTATFASYVAAAIQNTRLYSEAQEQAWVSTILLQVAEASQSISSADELFSTMVRLTRLLVGIKKCGMFKWDESAQAFILKAWHGLDRQPQQTIFKEFEVPAFARLRSDKTVIYIEDAAAELNLPAAAIPPDTGTLVMLPLMAHDALLGAFLVAHQVDSGRYSGQTFEQQVLSILQGIAHQTATALENLRLLEARQEEAYVTAVLLQVAQAVVSQSELSDILDTIVNLMPILVGIDACLIFLWDADRQEFSTAQAFTGSRQEEAALKGLRYRAGEFPLLDSVQKNDTPFFSLLASPDLPPEQWKALECFPIDQLNYFYGSVGDQWLLAFPLVARGQLLGIILAREEGLVPAFQERRLEIINGIAQQTALAIQNEMFKKQTLDRERMEREFQLARQIQTTFLPDSLPMQPGWEMAARWQTARQVGGDFYDIFKLGRDRLGLAIADVSDKGMPAALYMTVARTLIRSYARGSRSPATVLENVNRPLVNDTPNAMFVTAAFAMIWPETGQMVYANAGHNLPLIVRNCASEVERLPKGGMAMGVFQKFELQDHALVINPGDILLLYTDGVTECFSPTGEAFGEERLMALLAQNCGKPLKQLLDTLEGELITWRGDAPPSDDMTMLVIRRTD